MTHMPLENLTARQREAYVLRFRPGVAAVAHCGGARDYRQQCRGTGQTGAVSGGVAEGERRRYSDPAAGHTSNVAGGLGGYGLTVSWASLAILGSRLPRRCRATNSLQPVRNGARKPEGIQKADEGCGALFAPFLIFPRPIASQAGGIRPCHRRKRPNRR